jgi:hypothetical protein
MYGCLILWEHVWPIGSLGKAACKAAEIVIGQHDSLLYQHNTHPLLYSVWGDNNFVKTLSNFHSPIVVTQGIMRKVRDPMTKIRAREQTEVDVPEQQLDYCETYFHIDKGNGAEAKYDLSTESHLHGWGPKLAARYLNMNANNAYKVYCVLYKKHHPGRAPMEMKDCINNLTHSLLQQGDEIRQRSYGAAPSATKDLTSTNSADGRKKRADAKDQPWSPPPGAHGTGAIQAGTPRTPSSTFTPSGLHKQQAAFNKLKKKQPGRNHLSVQVAVSSSGRDCRDDKFPSFNMSRQRKRSYPTKYKCEECSNENQDNQWSRGSSRLSYKVPCRKAIFCSRQYSM